MAAISFFGSNPHGLVGRSVEYRPFDTIPMLHTGVVVAVKETKFGVQVKIEPDAKEDMSLLTRWRSLRFDVTKILAIPRAA